MTYAMQMGQSLDDSMLTSAKWIIVKLFICRNVQTRKEINYEHELINNVNLSKEWFRLFIYSITLKC